MNSFRFKYLTFCLLIIASFFICYEVDALKMGRVTNEFGAVIRKGPSIKNTKITTLSYGDTVPLISISKEPANDKCASGWYKLNYNGTIGYTCSNNISMSSYTIKVNSSDGVNVRTGAGTSYSIYKNIPNNKLLTLNSTTKVVGTGCTGKWYKLNYDTGINRYICSNYTDSYNSNSNVIVTTRTGVDVKSSTTSTSSLGHLEYGQALTLESTTKYKGNNCSWGYYKVYYKGKIRYVCSGYVYNSKTNGTIIGLKGGVIRSGPGTDYSKVTTVGYGYNITLESTTKYEGAGCAKGWYKIRLNAQTRYVCSSNVSTSSYSTTVDGYSTMIVRKGPGKDYEKVTTLKEGDLIVLDSTTKHKDTSTGCSDGWFKVHINGGSYYLCSKYTGITQAEKASGSSTTSTSKTVSKVTLSTSSSYYTTNKWTYKINENYATVRKTAGGTFQEYIYLGTEVKPLSTSGEYTKIRYHNSKTGWIFTRLIDQYSKVTKTDSSYCTKLKNAGFPESYCPYLSYLHSKYPNWTFKAEKTGDTFKNAVINESRKNYTQSTVTEYLVSNTIAEAPDWRVASDPFVAYMIDPRNYLNEKNIFVFESLGYDSTYHTATAVRSVVKGSYLDTATYASYFVNAGKKYGVSPVHLASRVKQEGGTDSTYTGVSGTVSNKWQVATTGYVCSKFGTLSGTTYKIDSGRYGILRKGPGTDYASYTLSNGNTIKVEAADTVTVASTTKYTGTGCTEGWYKIKSLNKSLKGYYNYYNIGAYGDNPVLRGVAAAAGFVDGLEGTPWNTRQKAITYGAKFIAEGYIDKGQDTLFYQKFNVGPNTSNKYTHQYMTNIIAPASESLSTYYLDNSSTAYVFKIPVYNSMPTNATSHPPVGSITAHLNALK